MNYELEKEMIMKRIFCTLGIFFLLPSLLLAKDGGTGPSLEKKIQKKSIRKNMTFLASDSLKGRLTGTPELKQAARFIAGKFKASGLKGGGEKGSYFQPFRLYHTAYIERAALTLEKGRESWTFAINKDFFPAFISGQGIGKGKVFFWGDSQSLTAKSLSASAYYAAIKGTVVLLTFNSKKGYQSLPSKIALFEKAGARGVVVLVHPLDSKKIPQIPTEKDSFLFRSVSSGLKQIKDFLALYLPGVSKLGGLDLRVMLKLSQTAAHGRVWGKRTAHPFSIPVALGGKNLYNIFRLQRKERGLSHPCILSNLTLSLSIKLKREILASQNVVAYREGDDPKLKKEVVVVGAHYDHVGSIRGGLRLFKKDSIWNGADDNASGTSALLEIAKILGDPKFRSKRTLVLIAFAGEEYGLIGSSYYAAHPSFPLTKTVAMLNMDMIGRNDTRDLYVCGTKYSKNLSALLDQSNRSFRLQKTEAFLSRSDQYSFYRKGIPVLFFSSGMHRDYHEVSDESGKINFEKIQKVAQLVYRILKKTADQSEKPDFKTQRK